MPPFGLSGPLSNLRAYGSTVEQASGLPFINGQADWAPSNQHVAFGDPISGMYAAAATMAALWGRERLGGSRVEVCQVECLFQLAADGVIADQMGELRRTGSRRADQSPVAVVGAAGDDVWLAISVRSQAEWRALCSVVGDADWSPDWSLADRKARADAIESRLHAWAKDRDPLAAAGQLQAAGVAAMPAPPAATLYLDPHLLATDYWVCLPRRYVGDHLVPQAPMIFDGQRPAVTRAAPTLGEHTDEVLSELGLA